MPPPVVRVPKYIGRGAFLDVPAYAGNASKALVVNGAGNGFQYVAVALASHAHDAADITSGTIADARIASTITRDNEVMTIVLAADGSGSGLDADLLRGVTPSVYGLALIDDADAATARGTLGLGTVATLNVGTAANNVVQLNASAKLPAVDGSQLTNLPSGGSPGGSTTQVQFNSSGAFAGDAGMTYDAANDALTVSGRVVTGVIRPPADGTAAFQVQAAGGSAYLIGDSTNGRLQIIGGGNQLRLTTTAQTENAYMLVSASSFQFGTTNDLPFIVYTNNVNVLIARSGASQNAVIARGSASQTGAYLRAETSGQEEVFSIRPISSSNQRGKLSIYNTLQVAGTPTNYERLVLYPDNTNNIFNIDVEAGGTGTLRNIKIASSGVYIAVGNITPTAAFDIAASTTTRASLRLRSGTAPTTPNAGDMWFDGTNLKFYDGAATKTITWT